MATAYDESGNVIYSDGDTRTALDKNSIGVTRKTDSDTTKPAPTLTKIVTSNKTNILSTYRSYTYRFTLACLSREDVDDPRRYVNKKLDLIILRSGGKEAGAMKDRGGPTQSQIEANNDLQGEIYDSGDIIVAMKEKSQKNIDRLTQNPELVAAFNKYSAGRFDMFIENVQIDTVAAFNETTNTTLPTTMSFDIIEPYSVNGLLGSMGVASRIAGWDNYSEAAYVLLVEFIGYPDGSNITDPVVLEENRYFTIGFSKMDIEITERGTVYKCEAFSWGERGNGISGKLTSSVSASGDTIGEILTDLTTQFNKQLTEDRKKQFKDAGPAAEIHDTFEIRFDWIDPTTGELVKNGDTSNDPAESIKSSPLYDLNDAKQITLADPSTAPSGVNYPDYDTRKGTTATTYTVASAGSDKKPQVTFKADTNIRDAISELVVNSKYVRSILEDLYENQGKKHFPDSANGMGNYFMVRIETQEDPRRDELQNKTVRKYIFVVSPYKIHRSRFPGFANLQQNLIELQKTSLRSYNYIYTGKNTEILAFKLQYNYMFFEALPKGAGNNDQATQSKAAAPDGATNPVKDASKAQQIGQKNRVNSGDGQNATPSTRVLPEATIKNRQGDAIMRNDDPYYALASNLHNALIDPKASMLLAEMDILGDPYFLCTGGIGNQSYNDTNKSINNNQAPILYGDMIIDVVFRNPDDIGTNGFISFNEIINSPFHGAYRIHKITNTFKDGVFKQHLELNKISGQDQNNTLEIIDRESATTGISSEGGTTSEDANDKNNRSLPNTKETENTNNPPKSPATRDLGLPLSVDEQKIAAAQGVEALAKAKGVNINELSASSKTFISDIQNSAFGKILSSIGFKV
jgi:hypothetical protein